MFNWLQKYSLSNYDLLFILSSLFNINNNQITSLLLRLSVSSGLLLKMHCVTLL